MDLSLIRLCASLSSAAYLDRERAVERCAAHGLQQSQWFDCGGTQALVAADALRVVVAFRGTSSARDIWADLRALRVRAPLMGTCHRGFLRALQFVQPELQAHVARLCRTRRHATYTGHSLGGALATLASAAHLDARITGEPPELVTFGSPRVGCGAFARALDAHLKTSLRIVNNNDRVARIPPRLAALFTLWLLPALYTHTGRLLYLDRSGALIDQPPLLRKALDRAVGRLQSLVWAILDGARDHGMARYTEALDHLREES